MVLPANNCVTDWTSETAEPGVGEPCGTDVEVGDDGESG